ncbi:TauD/TfdA family dioxygenase [Polaromonas sp. JS666]|uniref:TauD/TfdA dioxygenase family protein n=1 Tax=Polaromonas sp. (strain JS666 / ATCC BAA-500) TaxID=296591 RepID=UPI000890F2B4|nr:TauD/TfdA family dioxygenase [Polaromonas sp. JS666]SDM48522.1 taurine dioxygenase [Polaromonas sp. JS666]
MTQLHSPSHPILDITPVAGRIGAEVRGLRLSADISGDTVVALNQALLRHKVLFLRGQQHLDDAAQEAFAQRLGDPVAHPTVPTREGTGFILELDSAHGGRANSWHTDVTFAVAPPKISVLRGVVIPPWGGDTVWANTAAAYQGLPPALRELADKLWAVHGNDYDYAAHRPEKDISDEGARHYREVFTRTLHEAEHPVVRVHPETRERALVLGHFVKKLVGYSSADSQHLLSVLQEHIVRLENTVRWRWTQGDVVIWDNRATQHYAINDYGDQHRVVRRVTLAGDVPVSVDGRRSTPHAKAAAPAVAVAA